MDAIGYSSVTWHSSLSPESMSDKLEILEIGLKLALLHSREDISDEVITKFEAELKGKLGFFKKNYPELYESEFPEDAKELREVIGGCELYLDDILTSRY